LLKAASFISAVASTRENSGALLGGIMPLGLAFGRDRPSDPEWKKPEVDVDWQIVRRRITGRCKAFRAEFGSTMCSVIRRLLMGRDYDPLDPEDRRKFAADGGIQKCRLPPEVAARLAAALILEDESPSATP